MKEKAQISEERTAAASFILGFYEVVVMLKQNYANYCNILEELNYRHQSDISQLDEADTKNLKQVIANTKFYIQQTVLDYTTIFNATKKKGDKNKIEELYKQLNDTGYVMDREALQAFVQEANNKLAEDIIKSLLKSSSDVIKEIYD